MNEKKDWSFVDKRATELNTSKELPNNKLTVKTGEAGNILGQEIEIKKEKIRLGHAEIVAKLERGEIDSETAERMMRDLIK